MHDGTRQGRDLRDLSWAPGVNAHRSMDARHCKGGAVALPVHASQISYVPISAAIKVFDFDFTEETVPRSVVKSCETIEVISDGRADAVLLWWDLNLTEKVVYSTRPGAENWQVTLKQFVACFELVSCFRA